MRTAQGTYTRYIHLEKVPNTMATLGVVELGNNEQDKLEGNSAAAGAYFQSGENTVAASAPFVIEDRVVSPGRTELEDGAVGPSNTSPRSNAAAAPPPSADSDAGVRGWSRQRPRISPAGTLDPSDPQVRPTRGRALFTVARH